MKLGIVYYADAPDQVFRVVYPTANESELDDPRWITEGCDPARKAVLLKVDPEDPRLQFTGTP